MRSLVLALVCLATIPAVAHKRARASRPEAPPPAQRMDFDKGDTVEAGTTLPQGETIGARTGAGFESLLRFRTTFVPEMVRDSYRL
jgi:hypothetical protein